MDEPTQEYLEAVFNKLDNLQQPKMLDLTDEVVWLELMKSVLTASKKGQSTFGLSVLDLSDMYLAEFKQRFRK